MKGKRSVRINHQRCPCAQVGGDPGGTSPTRWHPLPMVEINPALYRYPPGTFFRRFTLEQLPVLAELGVGILWFMPLYPRGGWGSFYCVSDDRALDPLWGTSAEFRWLVQQAHRLGFRVLIDWVANHTAWEHPLVRRRPEFYKHGSDGRILHPASWTDVAWMDYANRALWRYQRESLARWVRTFDVDGFRMDAAGLVPIEFWGWLRKRLDPRRRLLWLAEADDPTFHPTFDLTYDWSLPPVLWKIASGLADVRAIDEVLDREGQCFPSGARRLRFLTNHDWHTTPNPGSHQALFGVELPRLRGRSIMKRYGPAARTFQVLCFTLPGTPLIYIGQLMPPDRRGPIRPEDILRHPEFPVVSALCRLYRSTPALHSGMMQREAASTATPGLYAFVRRHQDQEVGVILNVSPSSVRVSWSDRKGCGGRNDWAIRDQLSPWRFRIKTRNKTSENWLPAI